MSDKAPWITYRPELKVLDCTVRDGGLMNDSRFSDEFVRAVYDTCVAAGVDYMEIGYKNSEQLFPKDRYGPWRHCREEDLNRVVGDHDPVKTGLKLCAMADADKSDWRNNIVPKKDSVLDMIRVAFYIHQLPQAVDMITTLHEMGYETTANLMAVSTAQEVEIDQALDILIDTPASTIVVVDSFGAFYREQIDNLVRKYLKAGKRKGKQVGLHAHNNQQLAFANSIEAIILGANLIDATMGGMGRGAGNCPMELLIGFLRNPKFKLRPVLQFIQEHVEPLKKQYAWGALIPYSIAGQRNLHPRDAMAFLDGSDPTNYTKFYDQIVADI
jgi:4-hydroxy 2-oxovalerate aldolase